MDDVISARKAAAAEVAVARGLVGEEQPVAGFIDVDGLRETMARLQGSFPGHFMHAFACKAGSIASVLRLVRDAGMGCEVASPGELALAETVGFAPERIVFDSPAKSRAEIAQALGRGMTLNIDNFQELARVDAWMARNPGCGSTIGIRVNPQVGGGLPVNFASDAMQPSFADYAAMLRDAAPALFSGEFRVVTELGRSVLAKNGFILAKVEYTKVTGGRHIAITHAGAQVATRTVFMPELWPIRISALDPRGRVKGGARVEQDVAGPCCFAGDIIAHCRELPLLEPDDWILAHDTGAYYFSTPFVYNSLPQVAVHGFRSVAGGLRFDPLRAAAALG